MTSKQKGHSAYSEAGVNIDAMVDALGRSKRRIQDTFNDDVRSELGTFGGLYQAPGKQTLLVSSIDGVGTKVLVATMAGRHQTVGQDLVNHCVNDILVQGARPLFFMDYVGASRLEPRFFEDVIEGFCRACSENGCALLGGETAEMPGLYPGGHYDLVGAIVGYVEKKKLVTGRSIRPGYRLIGLPSTGLHTNGNSLARKILFEQEGLAIDAPFPGLSRKTVASVLLTVHRSYLAPVQALMSDLHVAGMAHITGGGLVDNVPRMLPEGHMAIIDRSTWKVPRTFQTLQTLGSIDRDEMYRVFNMGIGFVLAVAPCDVDAAMTKLRALQERPVLIGHIEKGPQVTHLVN